MAWSATQIATTSACPELAGIGDPPRFCHWLNTITSLRRAHIKLWRDLFSWLLHHLIAGKLLLEWISCEERGLPNATDPRGMLTSPKLDPAAVNSGDMMSWNCELLVGGLVWIEPLRIHDRKNAQFRPGTKVEAAEV